MNDLISRQAAQAINVLPKFYREYQTGNLDDAYEKGWEDAMFSLNALPTIEPKRGKWIESGLADVIECSECGWIKTEPYWNFCPHCGARMDL